MKNNIIIVLFILLIISSILINGCTTKAEKTESVNRLPVKTAQVVSKEFSLPIHTSGLLSSIREIRLSFKVGGIIERLDIDEGKRVVLGRKRIRRILRDPELPGDIDRGRDRVGDLLERVTIGMEVARWTVV